MPLNINVQQILLHALNFVILFGALYFLLYKPVRDYMDARRARYEKMDEDAKAALAQAEQTKAGYEAQLKGADEEIERRRREALAKCPEIGRVMDARREAVMKSVYSAFAIPADENLTEKVEAWNAQIKALLVQNGLPADYLEPVFHCAQCEDTGYTGSGKKTLLNTANRLRTA